MLDESGVDSQSISSHDQLLMKAGRIWKLIDDSGADLAGQSRHEPASKDQSDCTS